MTDFLGYYPWVVLGTVIGIIRQYFHHAFHKTKIPIRHILYDNMISISLYVLLAKSFVIFVLLFFVLSQTIELQFNNSVKTWLPLICILSGIFPVSVLFPLRMLRRRIQCLKFLTPRTEKMLEEFLTQMADREKAIIEGWISSTTDWFRGELRKKYEKNGKIWEVFCTYKPLIVQWAESNPELVVEDVKAVFDDPDLKSFTMFQLIGLFHVIGYPQTRRKLESTADEASIVMSITRISNQLKIITVALCSLSIILTIGLLYIYTSRNAISGPSRISMFEPFAGQPGVHGLNAVVQCEGKYDASSVTDAISTHVWCLVHLEELCYKVAEEVVLNKSGAWKVKPFILQNGADSLIFVQVSDRNHLRFIQFYNERNHCDMSVIPEDSIRLGGIGVSSERQSVGGDVPPDTNLNLP